jgi:hypothetical protein
MNKEEAKKLIIKAEFLEQFGFELEFKSENGGITAGYTKPYYAAAKTYHTIPRDTYKWLEPLLKELAELRKLNSLAVKPTEPEEHSSDHFKEDYKGVHETHCCYKCGCKYGESDCPMELEKRLAPDCDGDCQF